MALILGGLLAGAAGCGKKGPPLAPLVRLPAAPEGFTVRRIGQEVYIRLAVPVANADKSTPADIERVEVYAYTGTPGPNDNLIKRGTLVAAFRVRQPPPPGEEPGPGGLPARPADPPGAAGGWRLVEQGEVVTLVEPLTPAAFEEVPPLPEPEAKAAPDPDPRARLLLWSDVEELPARVYTAVGVSRKGRRGPFAPRVAVPLVAPPPPPTDVTVAFTEQSLTLTWAPPAGARRPVQDPAAGERLPGKPLAASFPATRYNVYLAPGGHVRTAAPNNVAAGAASVPSQALLLPVPVNEKPVEGKTFEDPGLEFGVERCYVVRSVDTYGGAQIEGEAAAPACVTPADIFPPAPPRNLAVVSSGGVVSLIWEPNSEPDLAGYLVLRAAAGSETLQPLTPEPVTGTTYRDTAVQPGARYVYAVAAVDRAVPPNVSGLSNRVEEIVR